MSSYHSIHNRQNNFTYSKCSELQQKMLNFNNEVLSKYNDNYMTINHKNYNPTSPFKNYKQKYVHVLPTVKKTDYLSRHIDQRKKLRNKQNITLPLRKNYQQRTQLKQLQSIQLQKRKKQYMKGYEIDNIKQDFDFIDQNKEYYQIMNKPVDNNNIQKIGKSQKINIQNKRNQIQNIEKKQLTRLQQTYNNQLNFSKQEQKINQKQNKNIYYESSIPLSFHEKNKQKYNSINQLNNQINQIMLKYDYSSNKDGFNNFHDNPSYLNNSNPYLISPKYSDIYLNSINFQSSGQKKYQKFQDRDSYQMQMKDDFLKEIQKAEDKRKRYMQGFNKNKNNYFFENYEDQQKQNKDYRQKQHHRCITFYNQDYKQNNHLYQHQNQQEIYTQLNSQSCICQNQNQISMSSGTQNEIQKQYQTLNLPHKNDMNNFSLKYSQNDQSQQMKQIFNKNEKILQLESQIISPSQSIVRQKIKIQKRNKSIFNQRKNQQKIVNNINIFEKIQLGIKNNNQNQNKTQKTHDKIQQKQMVNAFIKKKSIQHMNYLNKAKQRFNQKKKQHHDKSVQIDKSIQKLNQKIKLNQKKKKQLNLSFKPFTVQNITFHSKNNKNIKQKQNKNYSRSQDKNQFQNQKIIESRQTNFNHFNHNQIKQKKLNQKSSKKLIVHQKLYNTNKYQKKQPCFYESNQSQSKQSLDKNKFSQQNYQSSANSHLSNQKKLNKSIIVRKKPQKIKNQFQKLLIALNRQISLDCQFRVIKIQLQNWILQKDNKLKDQSINKWKEIKDKFNKKMQKQFSLEQIKQIFQINMQQHDPFIYNVQLQNKALSTHFCLQRVFQVFQIAQNHWIFNLQHQFDQKQLQINGFLKQNLDLENKGYILIQDLVRFLNMSINSMYRNRDLLKIYQRFNNQQNTMRSNSIKNKTQSINQKLTFKQIQIKLCKK